jgi:hypothetical protein
VRLSINDEEVSYSLEHERTLGEVVRSVQAWLASAGFVITGLEADGRDLLAPAGGKSTPWGEDAVSAVSALAVRATHTGDIRIAHWQTAAQWLSMLEEALSRPGATSPAAGQDPLDDLLEDLPRTVEGFGVNPFAPPGSQAIESFRAMFNGVQGPQVRSWSAERRQEAAALVRDLQVLVRKRLEDATHPQEALARSAGLLHLSMGELKEVSVLLQTGRDRPAMETIVRFADAAQAVMELLPFLPPDLERSRLFAELTPVLRELVGAFDSRDSVLIGDLLEYEVAPRLEKLAPHLGRAG